MSFAIIICVHSFPKLLPLQLENFRRFVKSPYKVFVVDDSVNGFFPQGLKLYPEATIIRFTHEGEPSQKHQWNLNAGIQMAGIHDCFRYLLIDNDMFFLDDFVEPSRNTYFGRNVGQSEVMWANLLYIRDDATQIFPLDFAKCPVEKVWGDTGSSTMFYLQQKKSECLEIEDLTQQAPKHLPDWFNDMAVLCRQFKIREWEEGQYDLLSINGTRVFHFRQMSNWKRYEHDFIKCKEALVLHYAEKINESGREMP